MSKWNKKYRSKQKSYFFCSLFLLVFFVSSNKNIFSQCTLNIVKNGELNGEVDSGTDAEFWFSGLSDPDLTDVGPLPFSNFSWSGIPTNSNDGGTWQSFVRDFEYIEQSINLELGQRYILEFEYVSQAMVDLDGEILFGKDLTGAEVLLDEETLFLTEISESYYTWETACFSFIATEEISIIRFNGISDWGYLGLDGICLYKDPNALNFRDTILCINETLELELDTNFIDAVSWQDEDGSFIDSLLSEEGSYWIDFVDNCGIERASFDITYEDCGCTFYIPNVFSPSANDITNQSFSIFSSCIPEMYELAIFDRWGNRVFLTDSITDSWKGGDYSEGTYVYTLNYSFDGRNFKNASGDISLLR